MNKTLENLIKSLPISNIEDGLKCIKQYDFEKNDFQTFLSNLCPLVDFTKISPLTLILRMTHLFNNNNPNTLQFVNASSKYLPVLIQTPNIFYENYDINTLHDEFIEYLYLVRNEESYIHSIIHISVEKGPGTIPFFLQILSDMFNLFHKSKIGQSLDYLKLFEIIFSVQKVRLAFFQTPTYYDILLGLFSKSVFPNSPDFSDYFLNGQKKDINFNHISQLNSLLSVYYDSLRHILVLGLNSGTIDQTIEFIRSFNLTVQKNLKEKGKVTPFDKSIFDSKEENDEEKNQRILFYTTFSYLLNFESTIVHVAFKSRKQWINVNPFTPYMKGSIVTMKDTKPLSVVDEYSWTNDENSDELKKIFCDDEQEIEEDKKNWIQKEKELIDKNVDRPVSDFFFLAHKEISLCSIRLLHELKNLDSILVSVKSEAVKEMIKIEKRFLPIILCLDFLRTNMTDFCLETLRFLLKTAGYDEQNKKVPERPPIAYQRLPQYMLNSCVNLLSFYNYSKLLQNLKLEEFIDHISILFSNKKFLRNPKIASNVINFLTTASLQVSNSKSSFFIAKESVVKHDFPQIVDFYSIFNKMGANFSFQAKIETKSSCIKIITFWLRLKVFRDLYKSNYEKDENRIFLFNLMKDLKHYTQNCINNIEKINQNKSSSEESKSIVNNERNILYFNFKIVRNIFIFVKSVNSFIPRVFNEENIADEIVTLFSFVFDKILTTDLTIENPEILKYDENFFIVSFVKFISMMTGNKIVMEKILDNEAELNEENLTKILQILEKKNKKSEYDSLKYFINTLNLMNTFALDPDAKIPQYLMDPITLELLTDPVRLPSGTVINRTTSLNSEDEYKDPVTLENINLSDIKEADDIKFKAQEFFTQHSTRIKRKNKAP